MKDLQELRVEIDSINRQLVPLFEARMNAVIEVARYKMAHDIPVHDPAREAIVLDKCVALLQNKEYEQYLRQWMQTTMKIACDAEEEFLTER